MVAITAGAYAVFLLTVAKGGARDYLYLATGTNAVEERGPAFLPPVLSVMTFIAVSLLVYSLLMLGTSAILALIGTALFLTSAQVALVFMSAPLWDMVTYVAPLLALLLALIVVLLPTWSARLDAADLTRMAARTLVVATTLTAVLVVVALARAAKQLSTGAHQLGRSDPFFLLQVAIAGALLAGLTTAVIMLPRLLRALRARSDVLLLVALSAAMAATIMIAPLINSRRAYSSSASIIMLILATAPLFAPIKGHLRLRAMLTGGLLATLVVSSLGVGTVTPSNLAFYLASGWQSASQLVSGMSGDSAQLGIPFTDGHLVTFVDTQGLAPTAFLETLGPMFFSANLDYASIGIHYLLEGTWSYPEPPVGVAGILWTARMWVVGSLGAVAVVATIVSIVLLLVSQRRAALFLLTLLAAIALLVGLSRPQMHQWWFLPIFGIWAVLYSGRLAVAWIRRPGDDADPSSAGAIRRFTTWPGPTGIALRTVAVLVVLLVAGLSTDVLAGLVGTRAQAAALDLQDRATDERLIDYATLPWRTIPADSPPGPLGISRTLFSSFAIPPDVSLLRVETTGTCGLAGLQFAMRREGLFAGETQRFFVGDTPSTVAYLPVIPGEGSSIGELTVQGADSGCLPTVQAARTSVGDVPIVAWLPARCGSSPAQDGGCPAADAQASGAETIAPPYSFEGYLTPDEPEALDEGAAPRSATSVSAEVLGLPNHGYAARDLWVSEWRQSPTDASVRVTGSVGRGVSSVGLEFDQGVGSLALVPLTEYSIEGSIFNRGESVIAQCFNVPAGVPYRIFVGAITDLYSPSWNDLSLDSMTLAEGPCSSTTRAQQWAPTLS